MKEISPMAQHTPPTRGRRSRTSYAASSGPVTVAQSAIKSLSSTGEYAELQREAPWTVRGVRHALADDNEIKRIAELVTGKVPSDRTLRRWAQQDRIPNADLAEALERHALIKANGGPNEVAALIGRSPSAVRKWALGRQQGFRGDANDVASQIRERQREKDTEDRMRQAGMLGADGRVKTAVVSVFASVEVRVPGPAGYTDQSGTPRNFKNLTLNEDASRSLAVAMVNGRSEDALAIIEEFISTDYNGAAGLFGTFDDSIGFHFDKIENWDVYWR